MGIPGITKKEANNASFKSKNSDMAEYYSNGGKKEMGPRNEVAVREFQAEKKSVKF